MIYNNFKPYPYVVSSGSKTSGIGLSGPGGLLWPIHPAYSKSLLKEKIGTIPSPLLLPNINFSNYNALIGEKITVSLSFILNLQRLLTSGSITDAFGNFALVVKSYVGAKLYDKDVKFEDIAGSLPETEDIKPLLYVVFAYDGNINGLDEVATAKITHTAPLDLITHFSGSLTPDIIKDNRLNTISFTNLIAVIELPSSDEEVFSYISCDWLYTYSIDNDSFDIEVEVSDKLSPSPSNKLFSALEIHFKNIECIAHPENVGYFGFYWGGINCAMGQSAVINVISENNCQNVLGPCWTPHTMFYPLTEINKTPIGKMPISELDITDGDLAYREATLGAGLLPRSTGNLLAENLISNIGDLLSNPAKGDDLRYYSFMPGSVDTRIIHDPCIYPITGPDDLEKITSFREKHTRVTRTIYSSSFV